MSKQTEGGRSKLWQSLQMLSHEQGIWRPNLTELLKGELGELQRIWGINLENDANDVRRAVEACLHALIAQLSPRPAKQKLTVEQRKKQYGYAVSISFKLYNLPELRYSNLQDRRLWLEKKERGLLRITVSTSQRDLNHAIDQMEKLLADDNYTPAPAEALVLDNSEASARASGSPRTTDELTSRIASVTEDAVLQNKEQPTLVNSTSEHISAPASIRKRIALHAKRRQRWYISTVIIVPVVVVPLAVVTTNHQAQPSSSPQTPRQTSTPATGDGCANGFCVTQSWPTMRGCDGATSVAMIKGKQDITSFVNARDFRVAVATADGGGSWQEGHLHLLLASSDGTTVTVQNIVQHIESARPPAPAWVYAPEGGCGDTYERVFNLNLDKNTLIDAGLQGSPDAARGKPPAEPIGPAFTVTDRDPALVRVDALSCEGNYTWTLDVTYVRNNKSETRTLGPFRSMGLADDTTFYTSEPSNGPIEPINRGKHSGPIMKGSCHIT